MKGRTLSPICIHTKEGAILTDDKKIANHVCDYFATVGKGSIGSEERVEEKKENEPREEAEEQREEEEEVHSEITLGEVEAVIKKLKVKRQQVRTRFVRG